MYFPPEKNITYIKKLLTKLTKQTCIKKNNFGCTKVKRGHSDCIESPTDKPYIV